MNKPQSKTAGYVLTVVIRDDGPMDICGDSPSYRSVQIDLTSEQMAALQLQATYQTGGRWYHESVSRCFIEPLQE